MVINPALVENSRPRSDPVLGLIYATQFVVISPEGVNRVTIAHKLANIAMNRRVGRLPV